ncbi:MAG: oligosaccharide flippase family protein [Actinomycetota bacterium]
MSAVARMRSRVSGVGPAGVASRAGWAGVVEILQLVNAVLVFVILANLLGAANYGRLVAVLALAGPAVSLTNLGSHVLLIKRVSQGTQFSEAWHRATSIGLIGPTIGALILIAAQPIILDNVDRWSFALLLLSQGVFFWFTELAVYVGNATHRFKEAAQIRLMVLACRLVALAWFAVAGDGQLMAWAVASFAAFALGAVMALLFVRVNFGSWASLRHGQWSDVREGVPYSLNSAPETLFDASDKWLLARYDLLVDAGIYGLGARIVQFGYLPLRIIMRASDRDLFAAGRHGVASAMEVTASLMRPAVAASIAIAAGLAVLAPVVPLVAGSEYEAAVDAIRLLALLPLIRGIQWLLGNCLSASDHQWWRVGATASAAALNVALNVSLLPTGSWRTAIFTTMVSELYLTGVLALIITYWMWTE